MNNIEHLPPQNIAAEEAVLGALLMDATALLNVAPFLRPEHFYREKNRWLYEAALRLQERREPVDFLTVCTELEQQNQLADVGGPAYLAGLVDATPSTAHAVFHARLVERAALLRRLISVGGQIAALAYDSTGTIEETLDQAEQLLFGISQQRAVRDLIPLSTALFEYYERLEQLHRHQGQMLGLPTGFFDLDTMLGGLQKSDLIIIASRPSVGKTSLGLATARHAALLQQCVAVFSLEMSAEQLVQRLVAAETQIDAQRLRLGDVREAEWPLLVQAIGNMSDLRLFIDDTPAISPLELRNRGRIIDKQA